MKIESSASLVTESVRKKLLSRFQQLNLASKVDETRLMSEIVFLAERADITEEIVRMKSHLEQCRELLETKVPIGRKLDFLIQEINRELNTIASKANDARISRAVVDGKREDGALKL